jgi:Flp pilus assembly protein TadD
MFKVDKSIRKAGLIVSTAMVGALLSGCAANSAPPANVSAAAAMESIEAGQASRAVQQAEAAVLADPRNASYRAMLGNAYLAAGRFASAETSFNDAMLLGETSPRTALSLALALNAQAKYSEAASVLADWESEIAVADLGLAYSLSGQPERGIHLMSNAIRGGENTVKMRQNLAYSYAMAGRWREARLMAAEDLPADKVGDRMQEWAQMSSPLAYEHRVAGLLGVPAGVRDAGQPVQLALANNPAIDQIAAEASALAAAEEATSEAAAPQFAVSTLTPAPASREELPAVSTPQLSLESYAAPTTNFTEAFEPTDAPAPAQPARTRYASAPVSQAPAPRAEAAPQPRAANNASRQARVAATAPDATEPFVAAPAAVTEAMAFESSEQAESYAALPLAFRNAMATAEVEGSHLVQLGSFFSEQGARRAWGIYVSRYPELADSQMVITQAVVRGKRYYRVSAGGFDQTASKAMCARVDAANGDGCITWAAAEPLPGAVDTGIRFAMR